MSALRAMTPEQLDRAATQWLADNDRQGRLKPPAKVREPEAAVDWQLSPVACVEDCDDDTSEIASMFAEYSGGRVISQFVAQLSQHDVSELQRKAEYNRDVRSRDRERARRWRENENASRRARAQRRRDEAMAMLSRWVIAQAQIHAARMATAVRRAKALSLQRAQWAVRDLFEGVR